MSTQPSRSAKLLHADEEQIDRASIQIADGTAFVVLVCPEDARAAALSRLRGRLKGLALPGPVELGTAEEVLSALREQAGQRDRVLSIVLGRDVAGALDALNLHREKLLAGGPVLVWLDDVDALRVLRERAPDAYSFRSTLVLVKGDGGALPLPSAEEPEAVAVARKRLKRARTAVEKARAGHNLAERMRAMGRTAEAEQYALTALLMLGNAKSDDDREVIALLCRSLSGIAIQRGMVATALYWRRRALAELNIQSLSRQLMASIPILATWPGPWVGEDRSSAEKALAHVRSFGLPPDEHSMALRAVANLAIGQGDLSRARALLAEEKGLPGERGTHVSELRLALQGDLESASGELGRADATYRDAANLASSNSVSTFEAIERIALCMGDRGELDAAEKLLDEIDLHFGQLQLLRVPIALQRGALETALRQLRMTLQQATKESRDALMFGASMTIAALVSTAHDAGRLCIEERRAAITDLELARDLVSTIAGPDGPGWYPIRLRTSLAEVVAEAPEDIPTALALDREALDLARRTYPDLIPETGRILAEHLLVANQPDEALSVIAEVEPLAVETGFLKERALLLAIRLRALVQKNEPRSAIAPHIAAFREALAATDSKRITAETLLGLARGLPPTSTTPDPFDLADEAHRLFLAMPMPAQEARCLEVMGDVLVARGRPEEAKIRYRTARARLERYGLGLRLPKINEKIEKLG